MVLLKKKKLSRRGALEQNLIVNGCKFDSFWRIARANPTLVILCSHKTHSFPIFKWLRHYVLSCEIVAGLVNFHRTHTRHVYSHTRPRIARQPRDAPGPSTPGPREQIVTNNSLIFPSNDLSHSRYTYSQNLQLHLYGIKIKKNSHKKPLHSE